MELGRVLVAADTSPHSEHALEIGKQLAGRSGASLAIVRVREPRSPETACDQGAPDSTTQVFRRAGVPGVEIARCAEQCGADLVVLGRNGHASPRLGTTTEMVLRRRHGLTLLIPRKFSSFGRMLYALDGSERGLRILDAAGHLPSITGGSAMAVCVLPPDSVQSVPGHAWPPHPRSIRVEEAMSRRPELGGLGSLALRWGDPVVEVLRHLTETAAQLLVLGLRHGEPGGDPGSGHIARDLLHAVPVAILTVPI
jgi:nucleotide-binding universal stress UspA family protein